MMKRHDRFGLRYKRPVFSHFVACIFTFIVVSSICCEMIQAQRIPVIRDSVEPNWLDNGQQFWFASRLANGEAQFWLVDARQGTKEPLFNHERLAEEIALKTSKSVNANSIPGRVNKFEPSLQTIEMTVAGRKITLNRVTNEIVRLDEDSGIPMDLMIWPPQNSLESNVEVSLDIDNRLDTTLEVIWVNFEGDLVPKGTVESGEKFQISSYATHVWLLRSSAVGDLGCFRLNETKSHELVVDAATITALKNSQNRNLPMFLPPRASQANGDTLAFQVTNRLDQEVEVLWVDFRNNLVSYAKLEKDKSFSTNSFVGHVWAFRAHDGNVLGCIELPDANATKVDLDQAMIERVETRSTPRARARQARPRRSTFPNVSRNMMTGATSASRKYSLEVREDNLWLLTPGVEGAAKQLTSDANAENSFRRSTQAARLMQMQFRAQDAPANEPDIVWTPNERYFIAWQTRVVSERLVRLNPGQPDRYEEADLFYPYAKPGDDLPFKTLRLFDAEQGLEIPVTGVDFSNAWSLNVERMSRDGRSVWINYNRRGHQKIQVVRLDLESGKTNVVIDENSDTFLHYSDGNKYRLGWLNDSTAIWSSERSGWNHLYRIDMHTGDIINVVTSGAWNVKSVDTIRDGQVWFYAVGVDAEQDPYHEQYCRVDLDGTNFKRLTQGDGMHTIYWSPTNEFFIDQYSRIDLPPIHELRSADGELICEIERAEIVASGTTGSSQITPLRFVAPGRDGVTPIWGIVHFPQDFDINRNYPILESIYAGPHNYHVPKRFRNSRSFSQFTSAGFVVVQIDGMGTAWRSKEFHDVAYRNLRDAGFPDRIAWIRALAKEFPNLDLDRVGIFGGSAGGQNAMAALLWHHDFYKVAVADCGCHDNRMDKVWWNEQWMGEVEPGDHYSMNSNLDNAHLLKGKLLLIVGEMDKNVDPASTLDVASRLSELGKDSEFELFVVPNAGHGAADTPSGQAKRLAFLRRHLLEN